ncbi:fructoselysine 6-kinase [Enterococcus saigonensis]|uniref:Fructoselysine 6-kinase n=1 Tax=Enterococcus saigonensis TaxID=1805431 RepID=A0A679II75_9ENTE|nr:fructoselysine 6-kinase [Enterococcus saigonensis]BCA84796.1 fructoselysine 6-kinase [Enterococcus saigonensis]
MKVLGLGDNVVDKYVNYQMMYPGGNALNFAVFAQKLGADSSFMGVFGTDQEGQYVKKVVEKLGLDNSHSRVVEGENGCARVKIKDGDRIFLGSNEGGVTRTNPITLTKDDQTYLKTFDLIHMGLYSHVNHLLTALKDVPAQISYDFSDDFTEAEIQNVIADVDFGFFSISDANDEDTKQFLHDHFTGNNKVLIVTRGAKSAWAYDGEQFYEVVPVLKEPVDTMAAGDSFLTAFLVHYLNGADIVSAMKKGNDFAGESCMIEGSFGYGVSY